MTDAAVAPAEPDDDETVAVQVDAGRTVPKRADLERQFVLESADPKWTSEAYEYTVHALQDAKLASDHIRSVDCRRSLCQVELKFASLEEARSLYELRHPDYELTYFIDADRYTVYFAREGVRLAAAAD